MHEHLRWRAGADGVGRALKEVGGGSMVSKNQTNYYAWSKDEAEEKAAEGTAGWQAPSQGLRNSNIKWDCLPKPDTPISTYHVIGSTAPDAFVASVRQTQRASSLNKQYQRQVVVMSHLTSGNASLNVKDDPTLAVPPQRLEQGPPQERFDIEEQKRELQRSTVFEGAKHATHENFVRVRRTISTPIARDPDVGYGADAAARSSAGGTQPALHRKNDARSESVRNKQLARTSSVEVGTSSHKGYLPGHGNVVVERRRREGTQFPLKPGQVKRQSPERGTAPKTTLSAHSEMRANKSLSSNTSICFSMGSDVSPFVDHPRQRPVYGKYGQVERYVSK